MKRPLSRLRLTPRGRLRRNVVLLLLLPLALLLVLRPCFTHQAALERLQSRFHFGPVDPAIESVRITCTGDGGTHTAEVSPDSGGLLLWCAPERLPTYTLYTAQAQDGQGQVLYTVERTMVDEHDII